MAWVTVFLLFQGFVLDIGLLTILPLAGVSTVLDSIPYANATVLVGSGRFTTAHKVPKATLLGMYMQTIFGVVRGLAGLNPSEAGIWTAAMLSELIELVVTIHCALASTPDAAIVAGDKPLVEELVPGVVIVGLAALWMLATFPKTKKNKA